MSVRYYNQTAAYQLEMQAKASIKPAFDHAYSTLVSPHTGLLSHVMIDPDAMRTLWTGTAKLGDYLDVLRTRPDNHHGFRSGSSMAFTKYEAGIAAIGEAIERYSSCFAPRNKVVEASYNELGDQAIHPRDLAMLSPAEYKAHSALIEPLDPDEKIYWTMGRSLIDDSRMWVPLPFIYSFAPAYPGRKALGPNISSGLAAGLDLEWAMLRGICEVVERDAFVITYFNQLPVPEIDLMSATDVMLCELLENRIPPWFEGRIRVWNLTTDIGISVVLCIILGEYGPPSMVCGAAGHVDPQKAATKAIFEALHMRSWFVERRTYSGSMPDEPFVADPNQIVDRMDHLRMACHPDYRAHMRWLLDSKPSLAFADMPNLSGNDTAEEIQHTLAALQAVDLTPIVFDLTTEDISAAGFATCRVLIPRTQQLNFGPLRRLGGTRLYDVPVKMGYLSKPNQEHHLNPVPHPFP